MATFAYRIRTTKKSTLTKVYLRFNVDRHTSFYAESQYVVWADAWDNKSKLLKAAMPLLMISPSSRGVN